MAVEAHHALYSLEDYLGLEEYANVKHEYLDGVIHAMAGGSPEHGAITMRIGAALIAHRQHGFFMNWMGNQKGEGLEYFVLAVSMALALLLLGGGKWSVDRLLARKLSRGRDWRAS